MSPTGFKILSLPSAARGLTELRGAVQARIRTAIRSLAHDPEPADSIPMRGRAEGLHRLRVGGWRVVYRIQSERRTILVLRIGHRSDVYRGFET